MSVWLIGIVAVLFNWAFWFCMFFVQNWEAKTGRIPPRRKDFPYLQDFWTNGPVGDGIGLGLIDAAVAMVLYQQGFNPWVVSAVAAGIFFGIPLTIGFYRFATMKNHKPNWGFMEGGKITWGGKTHLLYFAVQSVVAVAGLGLLFTLQVSGIALAVGLAGIAVYAAAVIADVATGRLPAVKKGE